MKLHHSFLLSFLCMTAILCSSGTNSIRTEIDTFDPGQQLMNKLEEISLVDDQKYGEVTMDDSATETNDTENQTTSSSEIQRLLSLIEQHHKNTINIDRAFFATSIVATAAIFYNYMQKQTKKNIGATSYSR